MKAGIKYCGGCNPKYDRAGMVRRLTATGDKTYTVETAREGKDYDVLVVICGCSSRCADYSRLKHKGAVIIIAREDDFSAAYEELIKKIEDQ